MTQETIPDSSAGKNASPAIVKPPADKKKHSTGARVAVALAFSTVAAKLGILGTAVDAADLLKQEPTFGQKIKALFNGTAFRKLNEKVSDGMAARIVADPKLEEKTWELVKAMTVESVKPIKWTVIIGTAGTVIGGVVGWIRGGRIENAKDILTHPIKSVKLIFGPAPTPAAAPVIAKSTSSAVASDAPKEEQVASKRWEERVSQPSQEPTAAQR